jgi:hypothetical protein
MTLVVTPARPGLWVDCDTCGSLTPERIASLLAYTHPSGAKVHGLIGYSEYPGEMPTDHTVWTAPTLVLATEAGFQALWVQHPPLPGWLPSEHMGAVHEAHASAYAASVGFPAEMHGVNDIEGTGGSSLGYGMVWSSNRVQRGGKAACYYGYQLGMTLDQCEDIPDFSQYWRAFNQAELPGRGSSIRQGATITIPGFGEVDVDWIAADLRGDLPLVAGLASDVA